MLSANLAPVRTECEQPLARRLEKDEPSKLGSIIVSRGDRMHHSTSLAAISDGV
jgi:hypothetical protein